MLMARLSRKFSPSPPVGGSGAALLGAVFRAGNTMATLRGVALRAALRGSDRTFWETGEDTRVKIQLQFSFKV